MKQKQKALAVLSLLVLILALGTAFLAFWHPSEEAAEDQPSAVWQVTDISVANVGAMAITNSHGTFGVLCYDDAIQLVTQDPADSEGYSPTELRTLVYAASHLNATKKITNISSLSEYGYDDPESVIVLMLNDGSELQLTLLMQNSTDGSYYLYREDTQELYLIDASIAALFLRSPQEFIEHSIFPTVSAAELNTVTELSYSEPAGGYTISGANGSFSISVPMEQRVRSSILFRTLIHPLGALYGEECLAARDGLEAYGLNEPEFTFSMTVAEKRYTAAFRADGDSYLMGNLENGAVYRIPADDVLLLPKDVPALLDGVAYYYSLGDCRSLCIQAGGQELLYELSGSGETISAQIGDTVLEAEEVLTLSDTVNSAAILRQLDVEPTGESTVTLQFTLNEGSMETVSFLPMQDGSYAVVVNGVCNFSTQASFVEALLALFQQQ